MEHTIQKLTRALGAVAIETSGHDTRFSVLGVAGDHLQVSIEAAHQRVMAVLKDANAVVRCTIDVAPVRHVTEDPAFPGRVTLHVGAMLIHLDGAPTLAIEVVSKSEP